MNLQEIPDGPPLAILEAKQFKFSSGLCINWNIIDFNLILIHNHHLYSSASEEAEPYERKTTIRPKKKACVEHVQEVATPQVVDEAPVTINPVVQDPHINSELLFWCFMNRFGLNVVVGYAYALAYGLIRIVKKVTTSPEHFPCVMADVIVFDGGRMDCEVIMTLPIDRLNLIDPTPSLSREDKVSVRSMQTSSKTEVS